MGLYCRFLALVMCLVLLAWSDRVQAQANSCANFPASNGYQECTNVEFDDHWQYYLTDPGTDSSIMYSSLEAAQQVAVQGLLNSDQRSCSADLNGDSHYSCHAGICFVFAGNAIELRVTYDVHVTFFKPDCNNSLTSSVTVAQTRGSHCPDGYTLRGDIDLVHWNSGDPPFTLEGSGSGVCARKTDFFARFTPPPAAQCGPIRNCLADPINPANGAVYIIESDVAGKGGTVPVNRYYNSTDVEPGDLGVGWRHSFSRSISPRYQTITHKQYETDPQNSSLYFTPELACTNGFAELAHLASAWAGATASYENGICLIRVNGAIVSTLQILSNNTVLPPPSSVVVAYDLTRDDGQLVSFLVQGSSIVSPPSITLRLERTPSGFTLRDDEDNFETYDANGKLLSVRGRAGVVQTLTYDSFNRVSNVTDSFGHDVRFGYDGQSRLASTATGSTYTVQYGYDSAGRLAQVTNADGTSRAYRYNGSSPNLLTSLIDESGNIYSNWNYDSEGRAISTTEAGGAQAMSLSYGPDGSVTTTDALGAVRTFTFERRGDRKLVSGISGSQCPTCSEGLAATYDSVGFFTSRTDYRGNVTRYMYDDSRGLEISRTEASGTPRARTIATSWHPTFRLRTEVALYAGEAATGTPLRRTTFTYDASGNLLTRTDHDPNTSTSRTSAYTYNTFGQALTADGPRTDVADVTTYSYYTCATGAQCGLLQSVTDALGNTTTYQAYNDLGRPLAISDPNGVVTTLLYDARQRVTSSTTESETITYTYYPTGLLQRVTLADGSYLQYTYDEAHRLTNVTDSLGNTMSYTLDAMGNRIAENTFDPGNSVHRFHSRVMSALNQLYKDINAASSDAVTTTFGYDENGNLTSASAPLSRSITNQYDELNRLVQTTDTNNGNSTLGYSADGSLVAVTDPRNLTTTYEYNGFGDLVTQHSPDTGTTTNSYDAAGNLISLNDARGAMAVATYDAVNRATTVSYSLAGSVDQVVNFTYDGNGHITGASDTNHAMSWEYDARGRVTEKSQTVGSLAFSAAYSYTNGNLISIATPSGKTIAYGYNSNQQITSVSVSGVPVIANVTYEPFGPPNAWDWGNGSTTIRSRDADGHIAQIVSSFARTYTVDNASRITSIADATAPMQSWSFGYDALDRLTSAATAGNTELFSYDANGNRTSQGGDAPSTFSVHSGSNRLNGSTGAVTRSYAYDAAGNVTSDGRLTLAYSAAGRAVSVLAASGSSSYLYNALGERVRKITPSGTTYFFYDEGGHLLGEYDEAGELIQEIVWLGDIPVASVRMGVCGLAIFYIHADHLNTPRRITRRSTNEVVWQWDSEPFGSAPPDEDPSGLGTFAFNLGMPGQYRDSETGLWYNYMRDYDPALGRYIESDPLGLRGGINTYGYVRGNPLAFVDPFGLQTAAEPPAVNQTTDANLDPYGLGENSKGTEACDVQSDLQRAQQDAADARASGDQAELAKALRLVESNLNRYQKLLEAHDKELRDKAAKAATPPEPADAPKPTPPLQNEP